VDEVHATGTVFLLQRLDHVHLGAAGLGLAEARRAEVGHDAVVGGHRVGHGGVVHVVRRHPGVDGADVGHLRRQRLAGQRRRATHRHPGVGGDHLEVGHRAGRQRTLAGLRGNPVDPGGVKGLTDHIYALALEQFAPVGSIHDRAKGLCRGLAGGDQEELDANRGVGHRDPVAVEDGQGDATALAHDDARCTLV